MGPREISTTVQLSPCDGVRVGVAVSDAAFVGREAERKQRTAPYRQRGWSSGRHDPDNLGGQGAEATRA